MFVSSDVARQNWPFGKYILQIKTKDQYPILQMRIGMLEYVFFNLKKKKKRKIPKSKPFSNYKRISQITEQYFGTEKNCTVALALKLQSNTELCGDSGA